ncbi:SDR family oxidoreductase [Parvularcula flava]|nr:SDR family NAD(P)-dependent oxidoreductase [Aquisalinus luteolus]NHK26426.1 SDR family oxidoreductase [Aquisalinus luteolus]
MLLDGRSVLVTGGSAGIGQAIAIGAARQGANVAINYHGDDEGAEHTLDQVRQAGSKGIAVKGDVADPKTAEEFVSTATKALGGVDVFVSNAGICPFHAFLDMPQETVERTVQVNLLGAYYMVQAGARQMVEQGRGGSIIAVSSISALVGGEFQTHYTPTKAGVLSLMQSTAIALGKHQIRCNALLPGTIETDINRDDLSDPEKRKYMEARTPLGRLGEPEDLAGPAIFLASDMARYVTGAALLVDGGMYVNLQ